MLIHRRIAPSSKKEISIVRTKNDDMVELFYQNKKDLENFKQLKSLQVTPQLPNKTFHATKTKNN